MNELIRLKTPAERKRDIEWELHLLECQKQAARREYEQKLEHIAGQRERLMKQLRRIK